MNTPPAQADLILALKLALPCVEYAEIVTAAEGQTVAHEKCLAALDHIRPLLAKAAANTPSNAEPTSQLLQKAMCSVEENLNRILEHVRDGKAVGNLNERREEIQRHASAAKKAFDWLDNYAVIRTPEKNTSKAWLDWFGVTDMLKIANSDKFLKLLSHADFETARAWTLHNNTLIVIGQDSWWEWETPGGECMRVGTLFPKNEEDTQWETAAKEIAMLKEAAKNLAAPLFLLTHFAKQLPTPTIGQPDWLGMAKDADAAIQKYAPEFIKETIEEEPDHEWWVYSTALAEKCLMLECRKTGKTGYVPNPSKEEWGEAFHAPSNPYRWHDESRVVIHPET